MSTNANKRQNSNNKGMLIIVGCALVGIVLTGVVILSIAIARMATYSIDQYQSVSSGQSSLVLRDRDSKDLENIIAEIGLVANIPDGATLAPLECSSPKRGQEYYGVSYVAETKGISKEKVLRDFEASLRKRGFKINDSRRAQIRPTVTGNDTRRELSATFYDETGLVRFHVDTECGDPEVE